MFFELNAIKLEINTEKKSLTLKLSIKHGCFQITCGLKKTIIRNLNTHTCISKLWNAANEEPRGKGIIIE